jgi:hypothetical protein
MKQIKLLLKSALLILLSFSVTLVSAAPQPAVTLQSMLNMYFDDESGYIGVKNIDLAFPPKGQINAAVALVDSNNTVVKSYKLSPDTRMRTKVFVRLNEVGPAGFNVTKPGIYNIVFLIDGKPISRLPVALEQTSTGEDPFNPTKTYSFAGLWQIYAYLTSYNEWKGKPYPELHFWVGSRDLPKGETRDFFKVVLKHQGKIIAHSRETTGLISDYPKHYHHVRTNLYHPHPRKKEANAIPFLLADWTKTDGEYTMEINRLSDGALLRSFVYNVKGGKIQPIKESDLSYEPHIDYVVPRVIKPSSTYELSEAIWLKTESK